MTLPRRNPRMKRLLATTALLAVTVFAAAQQKPPASPPQKATGTVGSANVTIDYSAPGVKGREGKVYGADGLIKNAHGSQYPIWRAGANAATTLTTDAGIKIGDVSVPAGKYTLFIDISDADNWTLIINKKTGEWGLSYDPSGDLGKTKMTMGKPMQMVEQLTYTIADGKITLAWENKQASVPVSAQ
jgi:hypothetical protein